MNTSCSTNMAPHPPREKCHSPNFLIGDRLQTFGESNKNPATQGTQKKKNAFNYTVCFVVNRDPYNGLL